MAQPRTVQHRPNRESKEVELKTEVKFLRSQLQKALRENTQLKRENARLRRNNEKLVAAEAFSAYQEEEEAPPQPPEAQPESKTSVGCPNNCNVNLKAFETPTRVLLVCPTCQWRKAG